MNENVKNGSYIVLNPDTGEVLSGDNNFSAFRKDAPTVANRKTIVSENGNFVWVLVNEADNFLNKVSVQSVSRLFYLATYLCYSNALAFPRVVGQQKQREYLTKWDIQHELMLSTPSFNRFFKEVSAAGIIFKDTENNRYCLNKDCFRVGKIDRRYFNEDSEVRVVRIFTHAIRSLYHSTSTKKRYLMGYLYRMIPYVNVKYNVICKDVTEKTARFIEQMKPRDLAVKIGYTPTDMRHLLQKISELKFVNKSEVAARPIARTLAGRNNWRMKKYLFVNPCLVYSGKDIESVARFGQDLRENVYDT